MTYDMQELRERVSDMRARFIKVTLLLTLLLIASVSVAIIFDDTTVRFLAALCAIFALGFLAGNINKSRPVSLFSREIRGKNVKEHEYVIRARRAYSRYLGFYKSRGPEPRTPRGVIGAVYILEDSGEVIIVDRLRKAHTDIYEDNDELLKPEGASFPIVLGRKVKKQPCPMCGEVNSACQLKCAGCSLGIINS